MPLSYLAGAYAAGGSWTNLLDRCRAKTTSSIDRPWRFAIYADELHPGNQLSGSARKCWAVYCGFLECGKMLPREDCWLTLMVKRSNDVNNLAGAIVQCIRIILEHTFCNDLGSPLGGLLLKHGEKALKLYFTLATFLQDGSAQKHTFSNRQDSGSRVCMHCKNIFHIAGCSEGSTVTKLVQWKDLDIAQDDEILQGWDRMSARQHSLSKQQWEAWQQACGLTFSENALLMSPDLRSLNLWAPLSSYCHDWMHGMASNGVMNYIIIWLLEALHGAGLTNIFSDLHGFLQLWTLPRHLKASCKPHVLFEPKKVEAHRKAEKFKCTASEILSLYKPLAYYISACLPNSLQPLQCKCFQDLRQLLDMLSAMPVLHPAPQTLLVLVEKCLGSTLAAGWPIMPKMHWCLHFHTAYSRFRCLPACWTMERKHKAVRKHGSGIFNTVAYERSPLEEVLADHMEALTAEGTFKEGLHLCNPSKPSKKLLQLLAQEKLFLSQNDVFTSHSLATEAVCSKGDYVLSQSSGSTFPYSLLLVEALLQVDSCILVVNKPGEFIKFEKHKKCIVWRETDAQWCMVSAKHLVAPVIWHKATDGKVTTLLPANVQL